MIEDIFLQYGAIGACFLILSGFFYRYYMDNRKFQDKFSTVVENNTIALTKFYEMAKHCSAKRKI